MTSPSLRELEQRHVIYGWQKQLQAPMPIIERARHIYLWDTDGNRYADLCSGQMNVNVGYAHPHILAAMREQMAKLSYVAPSFATEARIRLSEMIARRTPGDLNCVFFANSGAEAIENAIKIARSVTGRPKIYSAWQSYHGATAGASSISGDPRRLYWNPGLPAVEKFHYPNCYRCAHGQTAEPDCAHACLEALISQIMLDGPETVAAIVLEPIVGTSGLYVPPRAFMTGVRDFCDAHGILLVFDETMSGWGRTGKWFAAEHFGVVPDIMTTAKGITSGYVPLSATIVRPDIRDHFIKSNFIGGVTTEAHTLACATAIANIEVYERERLVERSAVEGGYLHSCLARLRERHPSVGDIRGVGLFACIELTSDRARKTPLAGYRNAHCDVATGLGRRLLDSGLFVVAKWDFLFIAPPLVISREEIDEAVHKIDLALTYADELAWQERRRRGG